MLDTLICALEVTPHPPR